MPLYRSGLEIERKADDSPVTLADKRANEVILEGLREAFPQDSILTEEAPLVQGRNDRLWLVDPLDGTADFIHHRDDFAVMIGLCVGGRATLGVVLAPALGRTWVADERGAFEGNRRLRLGPPREPLRVLASRSHPPPQLEAILERVGPVDLVRRGGVGVKVGVLAAGEADLYLHPLHGTSLWDCAAPAAIVRAAGGRFTTALGAAITFDPARPDNPEGVLVAADDLHAKLAGMIHPSDVG